MNKLCNSRSIWLKPALVSQNWAAWVTAACYAYQILFWGICYPSECIECFQLPTTLIMHLIHLLWIPPSIANAWLWKRLQHLEFRHDLHTQTDTKPTQCTFNSITYFMLNCEICTNSERANKKKQIQGFFAIYDVIFKTLSTTLKLLAFLFFVIELIMTLIILTGRI